MAGVGCVEHKLHPQRNTLRPSGRPGVHEGFGTGEREPEVFLAGKAKFTFAITEVFGFAITRRVTFHRVTG